MAVADVSVVIPCYNAQEFLGETIESIINQTLPCREIIAVNDGSTDKTLDILRSYKDKVKIISIENSGPAVARNIGIKIASSRYIAFCDADDLWHSEKIEKQMSFLFNVNAKFVCTDAFLLGEHSNKFETVKPNANILTFEDLLLCNYVYTSSVVVERDLLLKAGLFSPLFKNMQDWHLWLKISLLDKIYFFSEKLIYYRLHSGGISKNFERSLYYGFLVIEDILRLAPQYSVLRNDLCYSLCYGLGTIAYYFGDYLSALKLFYKALTLKPTLGAFKYLLFSLFKSFSFV